MKVFEITNVKDFMNKLLCSDLFDHFLLSEAVIQGKVTYTIDGHLTKDFYTEEERIAEGLDSLSCIPFSMLRTNCYDLIKGKKTPVSFRFIFMLSPDNLRRTLQSTNSSFTENDLNGVFINIRFSDCTLTCTTGVSYRTFSLDHSFEESWDSLVGKFLSSHDISYDIP
ncbi:MAG: DUF5721 family protein [Lachnospiraceae bacterium]|nr:DUF5721 family protein [Lachnospiraceae bacterium]